LHCVRTEVVSVGSFEALGHAWEALEAAAPGASVFQCWSWVGCLAEERYPDPVLLRAVGDDGRVLGLALFNRRGRRLCLSESGDAALDAPFIEHNAPLVAEGPQAAAATAALLRAAAGLRGVGGLVLNGVPPAVLAAAGGTPWRLQPRIAPHVALGACPPGGFLAGLSANARSQIRRSLRRFETLGGGPLRVEAAATAAEALCWFDAMAGLHAATWRRRGQPGAFATDYLTRFHHALVTRSLARGTLELLRVTAGPELVLGYLYNFRRGGRVFAYQSGFRATGEDARERPGLACHVLAIERARAAGDRIYDFLAGDARYKRSLANAEDRLLWAEVVPRWSARGLLARALGRV
jgi:CelD/BcsL family acetyltransferase involved in cellulose biosynthesis